MKDRLDLDALMQGVQRGLKQDEFLGDWEAWATNAALLKHCVNDAFKGGSHLWAAMQSCAPS